MLILFLSSLHNFERLFLIFSLYFPKLGLCKIMFKSIESIFIFCSFNIRITFFKSKEDLTFLNLLILGNKVPMSPFFIAPKKLSINACNKLSPSE